MKFETPQTIEAATALLAADAGARVLAGGTDLLVRLRAGQIEPSAVIDIKRIKGMSDITQEDGGWRIGAAVPCSVMGEHDGLKAAYPGVVEGAELIGSTQVQGRCTMVGNLCNAGPAGDSVPAMVAAGASVRIAGPEGTRDVPVIDIPLSPGKTSLAKGEFVTSVFLPARPARSSDAYLRFIPRTEMDIAVVGCAVNLSLNEDGTVKEAHVSLGAVAPKVLDVPEAAAALIGSKCEDAALEALATAATAAATPIDDKRGTVAFRKDVSGVLARRAAKLAYTRAMGEKS
ncbi:FAD binding domain-containing protein [Lentibacter sp. XHP0401]|jgi:CO/xanthine dehydrogenase FAD-binding subunit|uniref:FAD binding domain-containing protein n=1 Tax=Lentibacter sp. XHP0401 TaxID=2984334 RepID=UPI0021E91959|nr:xanthine dehydrogenase family protein subunit M [Lentibacter sp. XHP0401]MCV2893131.1 xanthine dehydrogenase family protein subunit M [Lentibacter sp. XHP0401]